ncbi:hypothetical protein [Francisella tularensis]|nr:hypothetical protein [Francisella tularensis]MBD5784408.1 hypothetical protein [Francisella tularensis subsp. holarctica]
MLEVFDTIALSILEVTDDAAKHFNKHLEKHVDSIDIYVGTQVMGYSG